MKLTKKEENKGMEKVIFHLDMDAFFASVEQLLHPEYRGKPLIVGGGRDEKGRVVVRRGVVSTASYEARKFGVGSAMPLGQAIALCPQAIVVPVDMKRYVEYSHKVFEVIEEFSPLYEGRSLDEAFIEMTGSSRLFGTPEKAAEKLQKRVYEKTGLTCSIGVATTKVVAKVASDYKKPSGITVFRQVKRLNF